MPGLIFLTFFTTNSQKSNDKVHKKWNNDGEKACEKMDLQNRKMRL